MTAIPHPLHAVGHDLADEHAHEHHELSFFKKYVFSTDHKIIGLQFLFLGLMFFVIGGMEAMLVRWQLGWPDKAVPVLGKYMVATGQWSTESMPYAGLFFTAESYRRSARTPDVEGHPPERESRRVVLSVRSATTRDGNVLGATRRDSAR